MQQYNQFSAEELATDPRFIAWVKQPDTPDSVFWKDWQHRNPQKSEDIQQARQLVELWKIVAPVPSAGSQTRVWAAIQANKKELSESDQRPGHQRPPVRLNRPSYDRWAAIGVGLALTILVAVWTVRNWGMTHYATKAGETKTVTLPDGSTVTLNALSSIRFASVWKPEQAREVALAGEAYFSVTHQQNHQSFVVETPRHLRVEVLGTVFTVGERASHTRVVLTKGKVQLYIASQPKPIVMKPGELVDIAGSQRQTIIQRRVTPEVYSAWTTNQFMFDNTSLNDIAAMLKNDMGYTVQFARPSLGERRMTIRLPNRNIDVLIAALAEAHDLTITRPDPHTIRIDSIP